MKVFLLICILLIASVQSACPIFHGDEYQEQDANEKQQQLQAEIDNHPGAGEFYGIRMPELFIQDNTRSFTTDADDIPYQGPFNLEKRPKLIHTVGLTAEVEFVSNKEHDYTGIFKGAKFGHVRFSGAKEPEEGDFVPGFTFKFFRDGVKSANIITMYNLLGQGGNSNPFLHDQTNHAPFFNVDSAQLSQKLLLRAFKKVSKWPTMLGLSDASKFDQFGREESSINFPYRVIFHPTKQARDQIPGDLNLKSNGNTPFYIPAMEGLKVDTLFEVYVQMTPMSEDVKKIGEIKQKTPFQSSEYGDKTMFYQHQLMEDDFAIHPEWVPYAAEIVKKEEAVVPKFERPDLPFDE